VSEPHRLSVERIAQAMGIIDPVFLNLSLRVGSRRMRICIPMK
jgi:hypothetical protein